MNTILQLHRLNGEHSNGVFLVGENSNSEAAATAEKDDKENERKRKKKN